MEAASIAQGALAARVQEILSRPTVAILGTSSPSAEPATTPVSWIAMRDDGRIAFALDVRGASYENVSSSSQVSLEVFDRNGTLAVRGSARVVDHEIRATPFPCAFVVVDVEEIRDHRLVSLVLDPPRYEYVADKVHYRQREAAILRELRSAQV